jgi:hypothetical protein
VIIIVRGWHKEQKKMYSPEEMAEDQLTLMPDGRDFANISSDSTRLSQIDNNRKMIPLLFTGFDDVDGRRVFDGDIYKRSGLLYKVIWHSNLGSWYSEGINSGDRGMDRSDTALMCKVIGNIYETPELLG